jgi:hypothetical protein
MSPAGLSACHFGCGDRTSLLSSMNPIQVPNDGGRKVNVLGIPLIIRIHGCDTNGVLSVVACWRLRKSLRWKSCRRLARECLM